MVLQNWNGRAHTDGQLDVVLKLTNHIEAHTTRFRNLDYDGQTCRLMRTMKTAPLVLYVKSIPHLICNVDASRLIELTAGHAGRDNLTKVEK